MASKRQIEANRTNAKRSTGPKTIVGKARSSRNARRHGLSRWQPEDTAGSEAIANAIRAELGDPSGQPAAQALAQVRLRLSNIRDARRRLLEALMECPEHKQVKRLAGLECYEKAARAAQRRSLKCLREHATCSPRTRLPPASESSRCRVSSFGS